MLFIQCEFHQEDHRLCDDLPTGFPAFRNLKWILNKMVENTGLFSFIWNAYWKVLLETEEINVFI